MSALEAAEQDIARGDYGMARQRLASYLDHKGYDPDVLIRLGRLSFEVRDVRQAGRYWFAAPVNGPEVEGAIQSFLRLAGGDHKLIVALLPRAVRRASFDALPGIAQERLRKLDLANAIGRAPAGPARYTPTWGARIGLAIAFVVVLVLAGVVFVGLKTIVGWLLGWK